MRASRPRDASPVESATATLDRVLELFERTELSATEMRVLLALRERRDATIAELADLLNTCPTEITRARRRLAMRGLIRSHHGGRAEQALLSATVAGAATIEALLRTLGEVAPVPLSARASREGATVAERLRGHAGR
jgi:DNA-binding MarR family transcriptional regulator